MLRKLADGDAVITRLCSTHIFILVISNVVSKWVMLMLIMFKYVLFQGEEGECESVGGEESEGGSACESSLGRTEGGSPVSSSSLGSQSLELPVVPPANQPEAELQVSHGWQQAP